MKANHLAVSLFLHAVAIAAAMLFSFAAKPVPERPARLERVTVLAPFTKRTRPKLASAVRVSKPQTPVLPVPAPAAPAAPVAPRTIRQFHPPSPMRASNIAPPSPTQPLIPIPEAAVVQSQSPLSSQSVAVALPAPQLKVGGIGDVQAGAAAASAPSGAARATGSFGDAKVAQQPAYSAPPVAKAESAPAQFFPLEILSKPRPVYTEEARKLHIQGEVLLEVAFRAAGDVQILRTVRGLGHGLDEAAQDAARQIRFRPARRGESAVDATAVVHIAFELAY